MNQLERDFEKVIEERDRYRSALEKIAHHWEPARTIAANALKGESDEREEREEEESQEEQEKLTGGEIMKGEKNTQKSGEGYPNTKIYGSKGSGNPTQKGGINRPTKGQG